MQKDGILLRCMVRVSGLRSFAGAGLLFLLSLAAYHTASAAMTLQFAYATTTGFNYVVEYLDNINSQSWIALPPASSRVLEQTLESTGRRVDEALSQLTVTLERVDKASAELEHGVQRVSSLLAALGGVGDTLGKVRGSIGTMASLGVSLGSLVMGAVRAAFGGKDAPSQAGPGQDEPVESEEMSR